MSLGQVLEKDIGSDLVESLNMEDIGSVVEEEVGQVLAAAQRWFVMPACVTRPSHYSGYGTWVNLGIAGGVWRRPYRLMGLDSEEGFDSNFFILPMTTCLRIVLPTVGWIPFNN